MGIYGVYFLYASVCGVGLFFVIFVVPETKGKTPDDLRMLFKKYPAMDEYERQRRESEEEYDYDEGNLRDLKKEGDEGSSRKSSRKSSNASD